MQELMVEGQAKRNKAQDRRSDQSEVPLVYFLMISENGPPRIKIGESSKFRKRLADHSKAVFGVTHKVTPLCAVRGERADEQQILRHFSEYALEGEKETFWPHEELVSYIRWLRDQHYAWVPDCEQCPPMPDASLSLVDASMWMPNHERRKAPPVKSGLFEEFGPLNLPPREVTVDDFYTNEVIINAARIALDRIDLDPASHSIANQVVKASQFFSIHDDGLSREWAGRVWLNPPFSQWSDWVKKIIREWDSGRVDAMCVLAATRTLTAQYFSPIHARCDASCILRGRIPFWGGRAAAPDDGHAVFYFGKDVERFASAFSALGHVSRPVRMDLLAN